MTPTTEVVEVMVPLLPGVAQITLPVNESTSGGVHAGLSAIRIVSYFSPDERVAVPRPVDPAVGMGAHAAPIVVYEAPP